MNSQSPGISHKVAKTKSAGLPRFSLGRKLCPAPFENVVDKIAGEPKAAINLDARQYPEFSSHFWNQRSRSRTVTAFCPPAKSVSLKMQVCQGTLATNANYLVYF